MTKVWHNWKFQSAKATHNEERHTDFQLHLHALWFPQSSLRVVTKRWALRKKTHSVSVIDMFSCKCLQFQAESVSCYGRRHPAECSRVVDSYVSPSVTLSSVLFLQSQLFLRPSATLHWNCLIGTKNKNLPPDQRRASLILPGPRKNKCHLK